MDGVVTVYKNNIVRAIHDDGGGFLKHIAYEIETEATFTAPGASGTLRASHGTERNRNAAGQYSEGWRVYNDARHALWVHEGTGIYGPTGTPIVPVNTLKKKYLHLPPGMGWQWTNLRKGTRVFKNRNARFPEVDGPDIDPHGHAESIAGMPPRRWLLRAAQTVLSREAF